MNTLPILAASQLQFAAFIQASPWLNSDNVTRVTEPEHLQWRSGFVLALPDWHLGPAVQRPREILEAIQRSGLQLVAVGGAE